jgi:hypothetical protein
MLNQIADGLAADDEFRALIFDAVVPLIGVLVGAGIAIATQAYFLRRQERDHALNLACAIVFRFNAIADMIQATAEYVEEGQTYASANSMELWQALVTPIRAERGPAQIPSEELALLASRGEVDMAARLQEFAETHNCLLNFLRAYKERRDQYYDLLGRSGSVALTGSVATVSSPNPASGLLERQLQAVAVRIEEFSRDAIHQVQALSIDLCPTLRNILCDERFVLTIDLSSPAQEQTADVCEDGR